MKNVLNYYLGLVFLWLILLSILFDPDGIERNFDLLFVFGLILVVGTGIFLFLVLRKRVK